MSVSNVISQVEQGGSPLVPALEIVRRSTGDIKSQVSRLVDSGRYVRVGEGKDGGLIRASTWRLYQRLAGALAVEDRPSLGPPPDCLNLQQRLAWNVFREHGRLLLLGGPGTGKSFFVKQVLAALADRASVCVMAPTARAAAPFREAAGSRFNRVGTIHSCIKLFPGQEAEPEYNSKCPLPNEVVIVDECSMLDLRLAVQTMEARGASCYILVGDPDQLPPVGFGEPFSELCALSAVPQVRLDVNVRQVTGLHWWAQHLLAGKPLPEVSEVKYLAAATLPEIEEVLARLVTAEKQPWILSPFRSTAKQGNIGQLNAMVVDRLLALRVLHAASGKGNYPIGCRVMFTVNNRDNGHMNGSLGTLRRGEEGYEVELETGSVVKPVWSEMEVGYASTVHKAQGSEAKEVILLLPPHPDPIDLRLVYTAATRARETLYVVGNLDHLKKLIRPSYTGGLRYAVGG